MTIDSVVMLFLGMAVQSVMNGIVNRGKPVQLGEAITKAIVFVVVAGIIRYLATLFGKIKPACNVPPKRPKPHAASRQG